MKEKCILVFLPDSLNSNQSGFLRGRKKLTETSEVYYITSDLPSKTFYHCIAFVGQKTDYSVLHNGVRNEIPIFVNTNNQQLTIKSNDKNQPITQIVYDYKRFKNSDIVYKDNEKYGKHFKSISSDLRNEHSSLENGKNFLMRYLFCIILLCDCLLTIFNKLKQIIQRSSTLIHFEESLKSLKWFVNSVLEEKKVTPKLGNILVAKALDLAIGIFLTSYVLHYEEHILLFISFVIENILSDLKGLLLNLMGQPIGLKLNYGFNNFLGQFFLYHISIWKLFLHSSYPIFTSNFKYFVWPGVFGFSYQIAMISDLISVATFHSYCIYVYAARLFNLQLRGLISLWRVLFGRKFNPLRNRVDSCQYSQNQLFIGTLSFTILLFLLPTTIMYYLVFSVFRLVTLFIDGLLVLIRNLMYTIPIYTIFLWIVDSSVVAGNIHIIWTSFDDRGNVKIEVKLDRMPLLTSIKKFSPDLVSTKRNQRSFKYIFHSSITGAIL